MKRGMARAHLVYMVLALVITVVWILGIDEIAGKGEDFTISEKCRASVERNARYHIAGLELGSEIECPTKKLAVKGNEDDAREKVANAMYTCWKQFGRGELELFSGDGTYCNVCYIIDVNAERPITGFTNYLMNTPSPTENEYYYDYLTGFKSVEERVSDTAVHKAQLFLNPDLGKAENIDLETLAKAEDSLETGGKYAVIFVYAKGNKQIEKLTRQITLKTTEGKFITGMAGVSGLGAGVGVGLGVAAVAGAPVVIVVGAGVAAGVGVFLLTEQVLSVFNPDSPPEWAAFTVLRPWNEAQAYDILAVELGCTDFVEDKNN